jgi:uncharacterized protein YecT (DUF1311 family)
MKTLRLAIPILIVADLASGFPAAAQERACRGLDQCEQLNFERTDKELTAEVARILEFMQSRDFGSEAVRQTARSEFAQAQQHWIAFRDSSCKTKLAMLYQISARTPEGLGASCLLAMTTRHLDELKKDLLYRN